jgi:hypothetical protein
MKSPCLVLALLLAGTVHAAEVPAPEGQEPPPDRPVAE